MRLRFQSHLQLPVSGPGAGLGREREAWPGVVDVDACLPRLCVCVCLCGAPCGVVGPVYHHHR